MLQNRVNPFGQLIKTPERGAWLGNRGVIHNECKEIVRPFKIKAWITCVLEFRGRHREIMQPNRWTELFFLDEATAFSAGHRPCFQCRYKDHQKFKQFWLKGNPQYGFDMKTPVSKIDDILQAERITVDKSKVTYDENIRALPNGTFVIHEGRPYLLKDDELHLWSAVGYEEGIALPHVDKLQVLTPRSFVNMFKAGYAPQMSI
ncbi:hypothetical protein FHW88_000652 [Mucilaginibacter sp. SG538B]|uniref:hypothetical protein n=1 Tax=unclassified Mucilaginibacter TaxID=2617802 RepID=UPI0008713486|nr:MULTISPECIES: hypothetical protein [unclassified Mucilaginibacter]NVM62376.1 hypothetical protein [Mucilaginibacter sp. SG538B]SCW73427.1 hypothetical protein SAMN03159284_03534 [Mucilaginibacter sp. NFR10]